MPPDLDIKVLFCYSSEVLKYSYHNLEQLKADNQGLCAITQDILSKNVTTYNVSVTLAGNVEIEELQERYGMPNSTLNSEQLTQLAECTLDTEKVRNRTIFDELPNDLLELKEDYNATVLVLQVALTSAYGRVIEGDSAIIGTTASRDNTVVIGRSPSMKDKQTYVFDETVLAHEFGHLMGCRHPTGLANTGGFDNTPGNNHGHCLYSAKLRRSLYGTIMSYADNIILYYSNPNIFQYPADFKKYACGEVGRSEAYLTVNANIQKLAGIFPP
ncbi:Zinc-dependent metalloprotease [Candidatus Hepatincola sp. Av]